MTTGRRTGIAAAHGGEAERARSSTVRRDRLPARPIQTGRAHKADAKARRPLGRDGVSAEALSSPEELAEHRSYLPLPFRCCLR